MSLAYTLPCVTDVSTDLFDSGDVMMNAAMNDYTCCDSVDHLSRVRSHMKRQIVIVSSEPYPVEIIPYFLRHYGMVRYYTV